MPVLPRCESHRAQAGWKCTRCKRVLCPDCVATKRVQVVTDLDICLKCGELVEPLTVHRAQQQAFGSRVVGALVWPLSKAGLVAIAGLALVRACFSYLGSLGWALGACLFAAVCFAFIRSTARGSDDFDGFDFGDFFADMLVPGIKALVGAAIVWVPAVAWLVMRPGSVLANPLVVLKDPVMWALLVAGVLYAPMAILVGASGGSLLGMLNPVYVARNALRLGGNYVLMVGVLCALFVPWFLSLGVGAMVNALPVVFFPRVLDYAIACYVPFVAARVMGLLLYTHGDEVGYGVENDYLVPVLQGVAPRGVAPEEPPVPEAPKRSYAPIELPEEEAQLVEASVEKPKELDPDKLPPLKVE